MRHLMHGAPPSTANTLNDPPSLRHVSNSDCYDGMYLEPRRYLYSQHTLKRWISSPSLYSWQVG